MATTQQYETGAKNLTAKIRESSDPITKLRMMIYLGNLRTHQYKTTGDERAKRLAENCYLASTSFYHKAVSKL
jgi:hypothetical protein